MYERLARSSCIRTDLNLLPHVDLWPKCVELESAESAMVIIAESVESELMGKIERSWKNLRGLGTRSKFGE
jgi:hypothetical protein